jgi:hypothetical protein
VNKILLCIVLVSSIYAKDFYFSFIDQDKDQISQFKKKQILSANYKLENIKQLVKEGQLELAYNKIVQFRDKNKVQLLKSRSIVLYADILYKRGSVKFIKKAISLLTKSINRSEINRDDLLQAYELLTQLYLKINKVDDAKYYAVIIDKVFDDPLSKAYGKIELAKIYMHKKEYRAAIRILYKILVQTNNMEVATVVADVLFDAYMLNKQRDKAYDLVDKVLNKNIQYYANDSFKAMRKIDKLLKANMPEFAIKILNKLIENATKPASVNRFKFKLANIYMQIAGQNLNTLKKAKDIYRDLIVQKHKTPYYKQARMNMDEILMREGEIEPAQIANTYPSSESMEQKVLLQELLNSAKRRDYKEIKKLKKIYLKISDTTCQRFGFKNIQSVLDMINANMIKYYLNSGKCSKLAGIIDTINKESLIELIKDKLNRDKFFDCMIETPTLKAYDIVKNSLLQSRDARVYFYLEQVALELNNIDDAYRYTQKIDMLDNELIKRKEFLYRFIVYGRLNSIASMDQFFLYAKEHPSYIEYNIHNPKIIDFYYKYYLYLIKNNNNLKAQEILKKLYHKQLNMKAFIYSPFVEIEMAKLAKLDDNYKQALVYLQEALLHPRVISDNQKAHIYFEMSKLYKKFNKKERYKDIINKCKVLQNANNFYKKMCDQL